MPTDSLETEIVQVDPRRLTGLEKNARSMKERDFRQLVENIRRDGVLLGAVVTKPQGDREVVLSGNHRVKAAVAAGLKEITAVRILSEITDTRAIAIQLSQNAIVGEDDQNILRELYDTLAVLEQQYSGLTDIDLGVLSDPDFERLRIGPPKYEDITLAFLPDDRAVFEEALETLGKRAGKARLWHARFADYEAFYETMLRTMDVRGIVNEAIAVSVMAELAAERLDEIEAVADEQDTA